MENQAYIYLDYASTSPRNPAVMQYREDFELSSYANIGRAGYDLTEKSLITYHTSKKVVAEWLDCDPVEVLYTYSATYALNILALALEHNHVLTEGDTILLSVSEHHANIVPWQMLAKRVGAKIVYVKVDTDYRIDLDDLKAKLDDSVKVVSLQHASNVTGSIHNLEQVRGLIGPDRLFFVDGTQMVMYGPVSMQRLGCDAYVFSGHKIMADTGIGVLALQKKWQKTWQSPIGGGGAINFVSQQEYEQAGIPDRWEPGTPHITGACTLIVALSAVQRWCNDGKEMYLKNIAFIDNEFRLLGDAITVFHPSHGSALGIWSFCIADKHVHDIADAFSEKGICVRSGHHCCQVLHDFLMVGNTVRISIGHHTTHEELVTFFTVLRQIINSSYG